MAEGRTICPSRLVSARSGSSEHLPARTELASHYFRASLPHQFDEYIWFDDSRAVTPLETAEVKGLPDTYPFGV